MESIESLRSKSEIINCFKQLGRKITETEIYN